MNPDEKTNADWTKWATDKVLEIKNYDNRIEWKIVPITITINNAEKFWSEKCQLWQEIPIRWKIGNNRLKWTSNDL